MRKLLFTSLVTLMFVSFFNIAECNAQRIDVRNQIESAPGEGGDMNSITIPTKKIRKKKASEDSEISMDDLKSAANVRYRKKRNSSSAKCYKSVKESCKSKKIDNLLKKKK